MDLDLDLGLDLDFGLDLAWISVHYSFHTLCTSWASLVVIIRFETTFGQVLDWVESHVRS